MSDQIGVDELALEKLEELDKTLDIEGKNGTPLDLSCIDSCFTILKQIITAAELHRTNDQDKERVREDDKTKTETGDSIYADYVDDNEQFNAGNIIEQFATNPVKWTIRVRAFKLVHRIVDSLKIKYLPDLIRLSFVSATSPYDDLKLQGFEMFLYLINRFGQIEEKEFPGHSILEQYRTQVISAIKPAFDFEAPPYITALACRVCSSWICQGLETDKLGIKRAYLLMNSSMDKLCSQSSNQNIKLYTESELEQERLDILGSWAQLYIRSREPGNESSPVSQILAEMIEPQISSLVDKWIEALKDYALLIIPKCPEKTIKPQLPTVSGSVCNNSEIYTREVALRLYANHWYRFVLAISYWICSSKHGLSDTHHEKVMEANYSGQGCDTTKEEEESTTSRPKVFKFISGIITKELIDRGHSEAGCQMIEATLISIKSLTLLLGHQEFRQILGKDLALVEEFHLSLYKLSIHRQIRDNELVSLSRQCLISLFSICIESLQMNSTERIVFHKNALIDICQLTAKNIAQLDELITKVRGGMEETNLSISATKTNLNIILICLFNTLNIISPESLEDDHVRGDLVETLETILTFQKDPSLAKSLLRKLDSDQVRSKDDLSLFAEHLYKAKLKMLDGYMDFERKTPSDEAEVDIFLASLSLDMKNSRAEVQNSILSDMIEMIASSLRSNNLIPSEGQIKPKELSKIQASSLSHFLKNLTSMKRQFPVIYEELITKNCDIKKSDDLISAYMDAYNKAIESPTAAKPSAPMGKGTSRDPSTTNKTGQSGSKTKIVLKTNFANFYQPNKPK